jgi:hypothetical protein
MSELRDRIIAVLEKHAAAEYSWGVDGCQCGAETEDRQAQHQADAVIAELGLYREDSEPRTVTNEFGATFRIEGGHRYVTDWKADDE